MDNDKSSVVTALQQQIGLSPQVFSQLEAYDDFINFYIQLEEVSNGFSWMKADMLLDMEQKLGSSSLQELSKEVSQPLSTITNYIRVAKAFPPETRDIGASFSLHFQASFADSYSENGRFKTSKRFEWLNKAIDENMSTRKLAREIRNKKQRKKIKSGDKTAMRVQKIREIYNDIQAAIGAISGQAKDGSKQHLQQLISIRKFIHGKEE